MNEDDKNSYHVESHNQQGGITAGVVNVGTARTLQSTAGILNLLINELVPHRDKTIRVTAIMGDGEAHQYAHHVKEFLRSNGHEVDDFVSQVVWSNPMPPISYMIKEGKLSVNVGSNTQ